MLLNDRLPEISSHHTVLDQLATSAPGGTQPPQGPHPPQSRKSDKRLSASDGPALLDGGNDVLDGCSREANERTGPDPDNGLDAARHVWCAAISLAWPRFLSADHVFEKDGP